MRKIYYILSTLIVMFLMGIGIKVNAMKEIPNVSEIRVYNLVWYFSSVGGNTTYFDLVVNIGQGGVVVYEEWNEVIINEAELLKLYGVMIFQFPRTIQSSNDEYRVSYRLPNGEYIHYYDIDYIIVKKLTNRLELHINNDTYTYEPYQTRLEGFRAYTYNPEKTYDEGYSDGYNEGYQKGRQDGQQIGENIGYDYGYNIGYNEGYHEGHYDGFTAGKNQGYDEGYNVGYNKGISEQLADKDFTNLLRSVFIAIGSFLSINLLPGIPIGAIIAVPIVFGIIAFILGRKKE